MDFIMQSVLVKPQMNISFGARQMISVSELRGLLEKGYSKAVVLLDGAVIEEISIDDSTETFSFDRSVPGKIEMYLAYRKLNNYGCGISSNN